MSPHKNLMILSPKIHRNLTLKENVNLEERWESKCQIFLPSFPSFVLINTPIFNLDTMIITRKLAFFVHKPHNKTQSSKKMGGQEDT